jgi:hypothetical protein
MARIRFVLTEFLREHYTTSREQAAGLAAYVLGAGFGAGGAAALRGQKPEQAKPVKAEEEVPQTTKLQTPTGVEANPEQGSTAVGESPRRQELVPALESGDASDSGSAESPLLEPGSTSTAATPPGQPGESPPAPRDDSRLTRFHRSTLARWHFRARFSCAGAKAAQNGL